MLAATPGYAKDFTEAIYTFKNDWYVDNGYATKKEDGVLWYDFREDSTIIATANGWFPVVQTDSQKIGFLPAYKVSLRLDIIDKNATGIQVKQGQAFTGLGAGTIAVKAIGSGGNIATHGIQVLNSSTVDLGQWDITAHTIRTATSGGEEACPAYGGICNVQ